jgi:hypothetical protein
MSEQEKKVPGWVAPAAGVGIAAAIVGVGVYLATRPQYVGEPGAEAPGAGPSSLVVPFTQAPVSQYTHEQIPVRALIYTQPPEGLTAQWYDDYSTVDAAWTGLQHVSKLDATEFAKLSASKQAAVKKALTDAGAFWQIRNLTEVYGGGDTEEVMYEGGFPLPSTMPAHKATYDTFMAKVKADAAAKAAADAAALLPSEDVQYEQAFKIDIITQHDGSSVATITNPDGTADQTIQGSSHDDALAKARAAVQLEMKGVATTTDYRGYKIVSTYFAKRSSAIGKNYELYIIAPDGTQTNSGQYDTNDISYAKYQIDRVLGAITETIYYNNYAINLDNIPTNTPPYTIRIYDPNGQNVVFSNKTASTRDQALANGKAAVDSIINLAAQMAAQQAANVAKEKALMTVVTTSYKGYGISINPSGPSSASGFYATIYAPANAPVPNKSLTSVTDMNKDNVLVKAKAWIDQYDVSATKKATQKSTHAKDIGARMANLQAKIVQNKISSADAQTEMNAIKALAADYAAREADPARFDGYQEGNRIVFQNGAVVDWRRRPLNPQGFEGEKSVRDGYIW